MNIANRRLPAEFGPETRFEVKPSSEVPFLASGRTRLEALKDQLLRERLEGSVIDPDFNRHLRQAANEAAALASVTRYPLLVFPTLFEECANAILDPVG
jgi:hypothetical protein